MPFALHPTALARCVCRSDSSESSDSSLGLSIHVHGSSPSSSSALALSTSQNEKSCSSDDVPHTVFFFANILVALNYFFCSCLLLGPLTIDHAARRTRTRLRITFFLPSCSHDAAAVAGGEQLLYLLLAAGSRARKSCCTPTQ